MAISQSAVVRSVSEELLLLYKCTVVLIIGPGMRSDGAAPVEGRAVDGRALEGRALEGRALEGRPFREMLLLLFADDSLSDDRCPLEGWAEEDIGGNTAQRSD